MQGPGGIHGGGRVGDDLALGSFDIGLLQLCPELPLNIPNLAIMLRDPAYLGRVVLCAIMMA
jgi:hypothetical protein